MNQHISENNNLPLFFLIAFAWSWIFWILHGSASGPQYEAAIGMLLGSIITMAFMSILFTWIYNNTGGSVFATLLFHTMVNLSTYVVFPVETQTGPLHYLISMIAVAIIILAVFGAKRMVREKKDFLKPKTSRASHFG